MGWIDNRCFFCKETVQNIAIKVVLYGTSVEFAESSEQKKKKNKRSSFLF